jgi:hypothetical protein
LTEEFDKLIELEWYYFWRGTRIMLRYE